MNKDDLRAACHQLTDKEIVNVHGRLAEALRRSQEYRRCRQIFIDPSLLLRQARVNVLVDGKELIMPGAGLKEGFYRIKPFEVPFGKLIIAVTYKGLARYGEKLSPEEISSLDVSMAVGEAVAVDRKGGRLGDGQGFFDLAVAIMGEMGGMADDCLVIGAVGDPDAIVERVPMDPWDVRCAGILCPGEFVELERTPPDQGIFWDELPFERIRKISPLWNLYNRGGNEGEG